MTKKFLTACAFTCVSFFAHQLGAMEENRPMWEIFRRLYTAERPVIIIERGTPKNPTPSTLRHRQPSWHAES